MSHSSTHETSQSEESSILEVSGGSIADRVAALQRSGSENWKKRLGGRPPVKEDAVSTPISRPKEKSPPNENRLRLLDRIIQLGAAQDQWRNRVEHKDAVQFTVAGKMEQVQYSPQGSPVLSRKKYTPKPVKIRSKTTNIEDLQVSQNQTLSFSPCGLSKSASSLITSCYSSEPEKEKTQKITCVSIPKLDDEGFCSFFKSVKNKMETESARLRDEVFFTLVSAESHELLSCRKGVKFQRKHLSSKNPLRLLSSRPDIRQSYDEVYMGVAERELERMKLERLAKGSSLALSALAGLASTEDFKSVALKKSTKSDDNASVALIQVKGRRYAQARLVQPLGSSMNHGDSYVLVSPNQVYCWQGAFSNVIERAKALEVAALIQSSKDLGYRGQNELILIDEEKEPDDEKKQMFFETLAMKADDIRIAGSPEEDELYEAAVVSTNAVYTLGNDELVPSDEHCGNLPKIEMLHTEKIFVFDFGAEMYVWLGKLASPELRKAAMTLGKELWEQGYSYPDCDINPLNPTFDGPVKNQDSKRPPWTIFAKSTQHMEPVLFKAKFFDWPNMRSLITQKKQPSFEDSKVNSICDLKPCDVQEMLNQEPEEPDMILENSHLGRGVEYFNEEDRRRFRITTISTKMWHISEYSYKALPEESWGQFHDCDTYVVRWHYMISNIGRTLHGTTSRHSFVGRKRWAYFFWQGEDSSINEKGASALMTVELNQEKGPHVRVISSKEPPCFLNVFNGQMVVYKGKREESPDEDSEWRLFMLRGEMRSESFLFEVECSSKSLRSRTSFVLVNIYSGAIYIWHGCKSSKYSREFAVACTSKLVIRFPDEMGFYPGVQCSTEEIEEGEEPKFFWKALGCTDRSMYLSLLESEYSFEFTPRLFYLTSMSGSLCAKQIVSPYFTREHFCPFPYLQSDLKNASQPALFLLDNDNEVFLWQGWFPSKSKETTNLATGSAKVRWDADRRSAMETALQYCQAKNDSEVPKAYVIVAGSEPLVFTNLFPDWTEWSDIGDLECEEDGEKPSKLVFVQEALSQLSRDRYTLKELQQHPRPEGVNPMRMESYLTNEEFQEVLGMSKEEFYNLPSWKQSEIKKAKELF